MSSNSDVISFRVNGSSLSNYFDKRVCLLGTFLKMDNSGQSLEMKTSDNQVVSVHMSTPIQDYIEGIIEVYGVVNENKSIKCDLYIVHSKESTKDFDMELYDEAVRYMSENPRFYITS